MRGSSDSGRGPFTVPRITGVQRNVHHPLYLPPANTYDTTLPEPWGGGARRLTLQPIRPKLRLIWHMSGKARRVRLAALLLGMIFLVAQCHFRSEEHTSELQSLT